MLPYKLFKYAIPILLVLVSINQSLMVRRDNLSPWKGGGFGMFSTVDSVSNRIVKAYAIVDGKPIKVDIPKSLQEQHSKVKTSPSKVTLLAFSGKLLDFQWVRNPQARNFLAPSLSTAESVSGSEIVALESDELIVPSELVKVQGVVLEIWSGQYSKKSKAFTAKKIAQIRNMT